MPTENATVCKGLLADLRERGLDLDDAILFVIDGGTGLRKAIRDTCGPRAVVQRCHVHKRRNVLEHLPAGVTVAAMAQLRRVARRRVVVAVPLEETPDPAFGHLQAFSLPRLARLGADAQGWSHTVCAADGGWLVLDRAAYSPIG